METIDLNLEEQSELSFKLRVEGQSSGKVTARLYCESEQGVMHAFSGNFGGEPGTVTFKLREMHKLIEEGCYPAWVEVVVENKQFVPAEFNLNFTRPVSVQVESVQIQEQKREPAVSVSSPVIRKTVEQSLSKPTLREKVEARRGSITGLDDKVLEDVTKSVLNKLRR